MANREPDEIAHERSALDAAHTQNEAGRDAFVALAHTALFAASVAFVGDVRPINEAVLKPVLIAGWTASAFGLVALALSFGAARRAIDAQRAALYKEKAPPARLASALNTVSLWSFPLAILCLFAFATANVMTLNERSRTNPAATSAEPRPSPGQERRCPGTTGTESGTATGNGRDTRTSITLTPSTATAAVDTPRRLSCGNRNRGIKAGKDVLHGR